MRSKPQVPREHSGASSCSFPVDADAMSNMVFSWSGHLKPKEEKMDTTCRKS